MRRRPAMLLLPLLLLLVALPLAAQDDPKCAPHPLFSKFPGASTDAGCRSADFNEVEFAGATGPLRKGGEYRLVTYKVAADAQGKYPTPVAVLRNHMNAVTARRGTIVYENLASGYFTARVAEPGGTWWITVGRTSGMGTTELYGYKVETIREAAMAQAVTLDAAALGRGLAAEGRVVLDGLRFATDQATILPESQPVLVQMAAWLTANPTVSVFIVGHTDAQGTLEHNRTLSRARAAAVVAALVGSHGVAAARLTADGVGPVAPVASNATDAGRARNRRVELVLR